MLNAWKDWINRLRENPLIKNRGQYMDMTLNDFINMFNDLSPSIPALIEGLNLCAMAVEEFASQEGVVVGPIASEALEWLEEFRDPDDEDDDEL